MKVSVRLIRDGDSYFLSDTMKIEGEFNVKKMQRIRYYALEYLKRREETYDKGYITLNVTPDGEEFIFKNDSSMFEFEDLNTLNNVVCEYFEMTPQQVYFWKGDRRPEYMLPRHVFMVLGHILTKHSMETIALCYEKDHATLINSQNSIYRHLYSKNNKVVNAINDIGTLFEKPNLVNEILEEKYFTFKQKRH